jgi:hypothetical protein
MMPESSSSLARVLGSALILMTKILTLGLTAVGAARSLAIGEGHDGVLGSLLVIG